MRAPMLACKFSFCSFKDCSAIVRFGGGGVELTIPILGEIVPETSGPSLDGKNTLMLKAHVVTLTLLIQT